MRKHGREFNGQRRHDGPHFARDKDLRYILDPADIKGPAYPSETYRVLKEKEIRLHGEYRTRRLVLEAWDRMVAEGVFGELGIEP